MRGGIDGCGFVDEILLLSLLHALNLGMDEVVTGVSEIGNHIVDPKRRIVAPTSERAVALRIFLRDAGYRAIERRENSVGGVVGEANRGIVPPSPNQFAEWQLRAR